MNIIKPRVLVIDPDPDERWNLVHVLQSAGALVEAADGAARGLEVFDRRPADLVISAWILPGESATGILRHVRRGVPATWIAFTARWRTPALRDRVTRAGAIGLLRQPVRDREVHALLRRLLSEASL